MQSILYIYHNIYTYTSTKYMTYNVGNLFIGVKILKFSHPHLYSSLRKNNEHFKVQATKIVFGQNGTRLPAQFAHIREPYLFFVSHFSFKKPLTFHTNC